MTTMYTTSGGFYRLNDWTSYTGFSNNYVDPASPNNYETPSISSGVYTDSEANNPLLYGASIVSSTNPSDTVSIETLAGEEYLRINTLAAGDRDLFLVFSAGDGAAYENASLSSVYQITQWGMRNSTHSLTNIGFNGATVVADLLYTADTQFTGENTRVVLAQRNANGTYTVLANINPAERLSFNVSDGTYYITTEHNDTGKTPEATTTLLSTYKWDDNYTRLDVNTTENNPNIPFIKESLRNGTSIFQKDILQTFLTTLSIAEYQNGTVSQTYAPINVPVAVQKITVKFMNDKNNRLSIPGYKLNENNELVSKNGAAPDLAIIMAVLKSNGGAILEVEFANGQTKNIAIGGNSDRVSDNTRQIWNVFSNINPFGRLTEKSLKLGELKTAKIDDDNFNIEAPTREKEYNFTYNEGLNISAGIINSFGKNLTPEIKDYAGLTAFADIFGINRKSVSDFNFIYGSRLYGSTTDFGGFLYTGAKWDNKYVPLYLDLNYGYNKKYDTGIDSPMADITQTSNIYSTSFKINPLLYFFRKDNTFLGIDYSIINETYDVNLKSEYSKLYSDFKDETDKTTITDIYAQLINFPIFSNYKHQIEGKAGWRFYDGTKWKQDEMIVDINYKNSVYKLPFNIAIGYEGDVKNNNSHKGKIKAGFEPFENFQFSTELSYKQNQYTDPDTFKTSPNKEFEVTAEVTYRFY